jgi:hypothetical protein
MDGKGRWRDNTFVERVWKLIKYDKVYLRVLQLHQLPLRLNALTPDPVCYNRLPESMAA